MQEYKIQNRLVVTALLGALAVGLGAFGAHALKAQVSAGVITLDQWNGFDTGVRYQMYHVFAMLVTILLIPKGDPKKLKYAWLSFLIGIILFSGSLYFLCTRNITGMEFLKVLGPVTPIGGLFFIAGWLFLAFSFSKKS